MTDSRRLDVAAVLAVMDELDEKVNDEWRAGGRDLTGTDLLARSVQARAAVEQMAADLAAAREEKDRLRSGLTACLQQAEADILALRQRAEAAAPKAIYDPNSGRACVVDQFDWPNSAGFQNVHLVPAIDAAHQESRPHG